MKFNLKSLGFYGGAIGFVVALFSFATAYGEANLKAPNKLEGQYRIAAQSLPGCLQTDALILTIQQSGIYLSGSLLNADETSKTLTASKKKPSLTGLLDRDQITLSGIPSHLDECLKTAPVPKVLIQSTVTKNVIKGKIRLESEAEVTFVGKREPSPEAQAK